MTELFRNEYNSIISCNVAGIFNCVGRGGGDVGGGSGGGGGGSNIGMSVSSSVGRYVFFY